MIWTLYLAVFLFGLAAGSFLNVCIYRLPAGRSLIKPRSFCPSCSTPIRFYDNIPVISFLLLRGRCRSCRAGIAWRYPAVELLTALLLLWLTREFLTMGKPLPVLGVYVYLTLSLIVISSIDLKLQIIPDEISLTGIPAAFILSLLVPALHADVPVFSSLFPDMHPAMTSGLSSLAGIILGGGSLWLVGAVAKAVLKKDAMGFGDVKLMAMVGGLLGWHNALLIFFLACGIGSVVGIIVILRTKNRRIPFGPFLAIATYVVLLYGPAIIYFITEKYPVWIRKVLHIG